MKIGQWNLHVIETAEMLLDGGAMFGVVPKVLWEKQCAADGQNRIRLACRCLLLDNGTERILIDTGCGGGLTEKQYDIYGIDKHAHSVDECIKSHGFTPDDITDVILTHLHFDHMGGIVLRDGDKRTLAFPNAKIHISRMQLEHSRLKCPRDVASYWQKDIDAIEASDKIELHETECELINGVHIHFVYGHTPGQIIVTVHGDEKTLLYAADLTPIRANIKEAWIPAYDLLPLVSLEEKQAILGQALNGNWIIFYEHDIDCVASTLAEDKRGRIIAGEPLNLEN